MVKTGEGIGKIGIYHFPWGHGRFLEFHGSEDDRETAGSGKYVKRLEEWSRSASAAWVKTGNISFGQLLMNGYLQNPEEVFDEPGDRKIIWNLLIPFNNFYGWKNIKHGGKEEWLREGYDEAAAYTGNFRPFKENMYARFMSFQITDTDKSGHEWRKKFVILYDIAEGRVCRLFMISSLKQKRNESKKPNGGRL